jgi:hypothetical protein
MKGDYTKMFGLILCAIIFIGACIWLYSKSTLEQRECERMNAMYPDFANALTTTPDNGKKIHEYYIKSAYNCCCPSPSYTHTYVSTCALKNCLRQGARCLDFQIYSLDNNPVVSVSSTDDFGVKETYNSIPFYKAMQTIGDFAFSDLGSPCPNDPIFINLRIMSKNPDILSKMAGNLKDALGPHLTSSGRLDIGNELLSTFQGYGHIKAKALVMLDPSCMALDESGDLAQMIDLPNSNNESNFRSYRYHSLLNSDAYEIKEFNTYGGASQGLSICLPDLGANPQNPTFEYVQDYRCQFVAMCFQLADKHLQDYNTVFEGNQSAFVEQETLTQT